jgi:DNA-binding NarL/FixJ family response regulator
MVIRVFIYDDSIERRESLKSLLSLQDNLKFVGEADNCTAVIKNMDDHNPHVVLMDINMPEADGIEGLQKIKSTYPEIKVLMQTAFDDSEKIFTSITNGANGYILKSDKPQRILQAIEEVYEGGAAMNPAIAQKVLDYFSKIKTQKSPLTNKENEVLMYLSQGMSYKMVADKLGVSYSTINTHSKRIYQKLHISSLGEAIAYYYKNL